MPERDALADVREHLEWIADEEHAAHCEPFKWAREVHEQARKALLALPDGETGDAYVLDTLARLAGELRAMREPGARMPNGRPMGVGEWRAWAKRWGPPLHAVQGRLAAAPVGETRDGEVRRWQRCPVCEGRGTVPHDFYTGFGVATSTARERCRTCKGGTVLLASPVPADGEELAGLLMGDKAREVVIDFFDAWRFCPVSRSDHSPRPCLEDAATQLLTAVAARLSSREQEDGDRG